MTKRKKNKKKIKEQRKKNIHIYTYKLLFMIRGIWGYTWELNLELPAPKSAQ